MCRKIKLFPNCLISAYYKRQLHQYYLRVVIGSSKCHQTKENTLIYEWNKVNYTKGSNKVALAIYNGLYLYVYFSCYFYNSSINVDVCGRQNKNSILMAMLFKWFTDKAPEQIKVIQFIFPAIGDSYLPSDHVFTRIEKDIKSRNKNIFSEHGTVISTAGFVYDWKHFAEKIVCKPGMWYFQFNQAKKFIINKNKAGITIIRGEVDYNVNTEVAIQFSKRNKKI